MVEMAIARRNPKCPYLFQKPDGTRLKSTRTALENACKRAGVDSLLFHDTRRTAVRNMVLAGIAEKRAMQISGHRTRSVFDRYDISTEKDAVDSGVKVREYHLKQAETIAAEKLGDELGDVEIGHSSVRVEREHSKLLN